MAVWSEVAWEVDFGGKSWSGELWEGVKKYGVRRGVENRDFGVLRWAIGMKS